MFKTIRKLFSRDGLDPASQFSTNGGEISQMGGLPYVLNQLHEGVTSRSGYAVAPFQAPRPGIAAGGNGGQVVVEALGEHLRRAHLGFPVDPNNGRVVPMGAFPSLEGDGRLPSDTLSEFGPIGSDTNRAPGVGAVDAFPKLSQWRDRR